MVQSRVQLGISGDVVVDDGRRLVEAAMGDRRVDLTTALASTADVRGEGDLASAMTTERRRCGEDR